MDNSLKLWKVRKLDYCAYSDYEGCIVVAQTWQRAKGIALDRYPYWKDHFRGRKNIVVEEIKVAGEEIITIF